MVVVVVVVWQKLKSGVVWIDHLTVSTQDAHRPTACLPACLPHSPRVGIDLPKLQRRRPLQGRMRVPDVRHLDGGLSVDTSDDVMAAHRVYHLQLNEAACSNAHC